MDLENFELVEDQIAESTRESYNANDALRYLDEVWYTQTNRKGRWMDLIGDYAGSELFILDGESLLQLVLDDSLLAIGRKDEPSFQILHALQSLERIIGEFSSRAAVYEIVFWNANRHLTLKTGSTSSFVVASRSLARSLLFQHLSKLDVQVHTFENLSDPEWLDYANRKKPMFVMLNDGGLRDDSGALSVNRTLCQRLFLFDLLSSGISLSTLSGVQFRDSKILSFVFESRLDGQSIKLSSVAFSAATIAARKALDTQESRYRGSIDSVALQSVDLSESSCDDLLTEVAQVYIASSSSKGIPEELLFLFLAHCIVLETVSVQDRALNLAVIHSGLQAIIVNEFLPAMFFAVEYVASSRGVASDVDGRLFLALVDFSLRNHASPTEELLGVPVVNRVEAIWSGLDLEEVDFEDLEERFPSPIVSPTSATIPSEPIRLLPFDNSVFNEELSVIRVDFEDEEDEILGAAPKFDFGQGVLFSDTTHWHNSKAILPRHLGGEDNKPIDERHRRRLLKGEQRFMSNLQRQAGTLTGALGASLQQIVISPVGSRSSKQKAKGSPDASRALPATHPKAKPAKAEKLSSADKLRKKIQEQKQSTQDVSSQSWWKDQIDAMKKMSVAMSLGHFQAISRNKRSEEPSLAVEMLLYRLNFELAAWILEAKPEAPSIRDKYTLSAMRTIKAIYDRQAMTSTALKVISTVLLAIGFGDYIEPLNTAFAATLQEDRPLSFEFVKLVKSKTKAPLYDFMRIVEDPSVWQLRLFGEYMDRSMDGKPDHRVAFSPDAWQREVLDCIDDEGSLLVVAPTSAGKTFISYYAMEKVLRNSDDGILVYVAPTKALVTQIAAEVYGRFRKDLKEGSCWAIHTRDYRIHNPQKCQILVTVPEMLAIMLLSPPLARAWTPRIKRIILDEIHSIGQQEGGAVWEQIILLAPCPVIGLSATVGSPEVFNDWLKSVQEAHGYTHKFISHPHRYSHLRKFNYVLQKPAQMPFTGLDSHQPTGRLRFLHPIAMLSFGARSMPPDLALEASDTLDLYTALTLCQDRLPVDIDDLHPKKFFANTGFLTQKDILRYEAALKDILVPLIGSNDSRDPSSALHSIIHSLEDPVMREIPKEMLNNIPSRNVFRSNLIHFVSDLQVTEDLPAILFSFDRSDCEIMAQDLLKALQSAEVRWRESSNEWTQKLRDWERWKLRAKERERLADRAKKQKKDSDGPEAASTQDSSWEQSFDPDDPSPQFSFASTKTSYSKSELDKDIASLSWGASAVQPWAIECLRRGIATHHAGMNKKYRSLVESLFRQGFIRVVIATGTLALGINAPTKTSVFCGDSPFLTALMYRQCAGRAGRRGYDLLGKVVFYGLPMDRVQRLVLSKIPALGGNFPLTSTLSLRLFNLLEGSDNAQVAVKAIQSLLKLPRVSFSSEVGQHQLLHHLRFSIEYLRRARLLDREGRPMNLFGIAAHLFYTEPSNLALVALLRNGVLHKVCGQRSLIDSKRDFIILMAHLFGRRYLPRSYTTDENIRLIIKKSPSIVVLPPLPKVAREVLLAHDEEILRVFTGYVSTYASQYADKLKPDDQLPLSHQSYAGDSAPTSTPFRRHLSSTAISVVARSPFVANSGHNETYRSISELARTSRSGLHLNEHVIPSMAHITAKPGKRGSDTFALNAYLLDFYMHGQVAALATANGIRRGEVWFLLQDFTLSLMTIRNVLEQLLLKASKEATRAEPEVDEDLEVDSGYGSFDPAEADGDDNDESGASFKRPKGVSDLDWKVYEVVDGALREFEEKYKAMWA